MKRRPPVRRDSWSSPTRRRASEVWQALMLQVLGGNLCRDRGRQPTARFRVDGSLETEMDARDDAVKDSLSI